MIGAVRHACGRLAWYVGSVMGDRDYRRYLEHHAAQGGTEPPMSEREYWRDRWAHADAHPEGRCC